MAEDQDVGFGLEEGQMLGCKVLEETDALPIVCHLRVQDSCHKDNVCLVILVDAQWRCVHLLDPPQVHHCSAETSAAQYKK